MPSNKPGSRLIRAAGGVAWRPGPDGSPHVLLVHRKKYDDWSLPKGKIEPGEPLPVTAVREVLEEGGARLALGRRLASVRYNVGGRPKRVHYWAARVLSVDSRAIPNAEVDEVAWLPAEHAVKKVSYPHDHGVLADFAARPPHTVPLILLRHAKALPKGSWKRADADRPLDDSGRYAAKDLADLLACFAPGFRLLSSPAARCTETLRPLSQLTGDPVVEEPSLYTHHEPATGEADPETANAALIRAAIASGKPTVVCAHRENMPALREAALAALTGYSAAGQAPGGKGSAGKGSGGKGSGGTGPSGTGSSGTGSSGTGSSGKAPRGMEAADSAARDTFELPRDWDETLPTSGFWVLNIAPLPVEAEPEQAPEPGRAAPEPQAPVAPSGRRAWWRRLRPLARRGDAGARREEPRGDSEAGRADVGGQGSGISSPGDAPAGDAPAGDAPAGDAPAGDAAAARPVGVLISADRYDLSELAES
jgi:8-oxo-dGTP pyrophosphatase MutT (NUDIX family)/phosphohistidine phosphatase SixA